MWCALILGLVVGGVSGVLGIGGGVLLIPGLMYFLKYDQKTAQGTTLAALVPPIGLGAAIQYYRQGALRPWAALCVALGFSVGAYITAGFISWIPKDLLAQLFGALLLFLGIKLMFSSERPAIIFAIAAVVWLFSWITFVTFRRWGRAHGIRPHFKDALEYVEKKSPPGSDYQI